MTVLTICQNAADRIGVARPSSLINSTDQQSLRLLGYAQQEGKALARRHTWQILTKEQTFTATATETQSSAIPSDFDRFVDETCFNRTRKREVYGPLNENEWQFAKAVVSPVIIEAFRYRGGSFLMTPTPTAGDTIAFEYISKNWCQSSGGTGQAAWAADTDTGVLEEELMTLGVVWRFKAGQGFDYQEDFNAYELMVAQAIARDGGKRVLNTSRRGRPFRRAPYVQEGSWSIS
ncbi:MAG TPA: hypothetical protein VEA16_09755 [Vicinamibacterales bacterium]|nr:hypothetical protein [Vicinamibacterales bacterium]